MDKKTVEHFELLKRKLFWAELALLNISQISSGLDCKEYAKDILKRINMMDKEA